LGEKKLKQAAMWKSRDIVSKQLSKNHRALHVAETERPSDLVQKGATQLATEHPP
jgi:hypothetical protein